MWRESHSSQQRSRRAISRSRWKATRWPREPSAARCFGSYGQLDAEIDRISDVSAAAIRTDRAIKGPGRKIPTSSLQPSRPYPRPGLHRLVAISAMSSSREARAELARPAAFASQRSANIAGAVKRCWPRRSSFAPHRARAEQPGCRGGESKRIRFEATGPARSRPVPTRIPRCLQLHVERERPCRCARRCYRQDGGADVTARRASVVAGSPIHGW